MNDTAVTATSTQWAIREHRYDGNIDVRSADNEKHARTMYEDVTEHHATLNRETRKFVGTERYELVSRPVTDYDDGSRRVGAWVVAE